MTRTERLLQHVNRQGRGIEIGPSHSPVAPKRDGFDVRIIDTLDQAGLRAKYATHAVDRDRIEAVDYVWTGQRYADLVPPPHAFDWIIASHVIEHTPDLIAFLNDCAALLAPEGVLSLAIPDKRYCFDRFRPTSALAHVLDAHLRGATHHSPGSIAEFMLNAVSRGGSIAWSPEAAGEFKALCSLEEVAAHFREARTAPSGLDVHAWCFTPASFRLLVRDLNALGLIALREVASHPTDASEFYVTLGKHGALPAEDRLELAERARAEMG